MLRSLVLILLFVNAAFFAWSRGWLDDVIGVSPDVQHEPQRLAQQVNADKIVVVAAASSAVEGGAPALPVESAEAASEAASGAAAEGPEEAASAAEMDVSAAAQTEGAAAVNAAVPPAVAAASTKGLCLEAGPFTAAEYATAEAMMRPVLSAALWTRQNISVQGMWLVYMGPYADAEQLQRKQDELKRIKGLEFEVVRTPPALAQGISLGRFSKQENAENQLETLRNRGIRTARIVTQRPAAELQMIRVPRADTAAQVKLAGLKLPQGKRFTACR